MTDLRWISDCQGYVYYSSVRLTDTIIPEGMSTLLEMIKTTLDEYNIRHSIRYCDDILTFTISRTFEIILSQTAIYLHASSRTIVSILLESFNTESIVQLIKTIRVHTFASRIYSMEFNLYTISEIHDLLEGRSYIG